MKCDGMWNVEAGSQKRATLSAITPFLHLSIIHYFEPWAVGLVYHNRESSFVMFGILCLAVLLVCQLFLLKGSTALVAQNICLQTSRPANAAADGRQSHPNSRSATSKLFQNDNTISNDDISRRKALQKIVTSSSASMLTQVQPSYSIDTSPIPNLGCLLDLPPITAGCVRVYLCRHGQTEYNRLRKVQGARVNPPINQTGQAIRLGETLSMLKQNSATEFPRVALHSTLQRARETATVVSLMIGKGSYNERENVAYVDEVLSRDNPLSNNDFKGMLQLKTLPSLGEVDFGSIEGKSVNDAKAEMMTTWAKWSLGKIDAIDGNDGESGRNVFQRVSLALNSLTEIAASTGGSVIAVTHSAYLRMFLSLALELPLVEAASLDQKNCCINVLDLSLTETVTIDAKSKVFGGRLSMAPNDFILEFPRAKVIVMNEIRHLTELV
eukprot:scaffold338_cov231-Chaetoceros_neogracile.AAC.13